MGEVGGRGGGVLTLFNPLDPPPPPQTPKVPEVRDVTRIECIGEGLGGGGGVS